MNTSVTTFVGAAGVAGAIIVGQHRVGVAVDHVVVHGRQIPDVFMAGALERVVGAVVGHVEAHGEFLLRAERGLFARLSVFTGGWTLEAVEAVCTGDALDLLTHLVDKSLVIADAIGQTERYRMLETVREYGHERLIEWGQADAARNQHLKFFLGLAEEAESKLKGGEQKAWLERLEAELDNVRAALTWALETEPVLALKLASALDLFWDVHGHLSEGRRWLKRALAQSAQPPPDVRARALYTAGGLAWLQGDYPLALELLGRVLTIKPETGQ